MLCFGFLAPRPDQGSDLNPLPWKVNLSHWTSREVPFPLTLSCPFWWPILGDPARPRPEELSSDWLGPHGWTVRAGSSPVECPSVRPCAGMLGLDLQGLTLGV